MSNMVSVGAVKCACNSGTPPGTVQEETVAMSCTITVKVGCNLAVSLLVITFLRSIIRTSSKITFYLYRDAATHCHCVF
jgi:hypothetical protein